MATKRELTLADDRGWALFIGTVESLNDEQVAETGYYPDQGWSVKDLMAHIGFWMTEAANMLEQMRFGTYDPAAVDAETLNKRVLRGQPRPVRSPSSARSASPRTRACSRSWMPCPSWTARPRSGSRNPPTGITASTSRGWTNGWRSSGLGRGREREPPLESPHGR